MFTRITTYILAIPVLEKFKVDDPVGAFPVHYAAGIWGMIAVGLFADGDLRNELGIIKGDHGYLLGCNLLACLVITMWSGGVTAIIVSIAHVKFYVRVEQSSILKYLWRGNIFETLVSEK